MTNLQTMYGLIDASYLKIIYYFGLQIIRSLSKSKSKCTFYKESIYGWDQTSANTGAAGSWYQSISDLTQYDFESVK